MQYPRIYIITKYHFESLQVVVKHFTGDISFMENPAKSI